MISRKECLLFVTYMMMCKTCSILGEISYPVNNTILTNMSFLRQRLISYVKK